MYLVERGGWKQTDLLFGVVKSNGAFLGPKPTWSFERLTCKYPGHEARKGHFIAFSPGYPALLHEPHESLRNEVYVVPHRMTDTQVVTSARSLWKLGGYDGEGEHACHWFVQKLLHGYGIQTPGRLNGQRSNHYHQDENPYVKFNKKTGYWALITPYEERTNPNSRDFE